MTRTIMSKTLLS